MLLARICSILSCLDPAARLPAAVSHNLPTAPCFKVILASCNMKSQVLFDAMSAAVKSKGPELCQDGRCCYLAGKPLSEIATNFCFQVGLRKEAAEEMPQFCATVEVFQFVISDAGPEGKVRARSEERQRVQLKQVRESGAVST